MLKHTKEIIQEAKKLLDKIESKELFSEIPEMPINKKNKSELINSFKEKSTSENSN